MKIALIGATGFVGSAILQEALNRGHEVTAIVRYPEKLQSQKNLSVVEGDVMVARELSTLLEGNEELDWTLVSNRQKCLLQFYSNRPNCILFSFCY